MSDGGGFIEARLGPCLYLGRGGPAYSAGGWCALLSLILVWGILVGALMVKRVNSRRADWTAHSLQVEARGY